jgi:ferritin-like protein
MLTTGTTGDCCEQGAGGRRGERTQAAASNHARTICEWTVATVALGLENAAAQTYVFATANVSDPGGIATAASIAPVEAMHAAILSFVLGKYPVPDLDIGISMAVPPAALTA